LHVSPPYCREPSCRITNGSPPQSIPSGGVITETSGLVASRNDTRLLWGHNDGPDSISLFAIRNDGKYLGKYILDSSTTYAMEDIAFGPGPVAGVNYIYLGLIGDNNETAAFRSFYRVAEPAIDVDKVPSSPDKAPIVNVSGAQLFKFKYPDKAHNCEAMFVDPFTGDLFLPVKSRTDPDPGKTGRVFRIAASDMKTGVTITATHVATVTSRVNYVQSVGLTAADISSDGTKIIMKNPVEGFLWTRDPATETVAEVLSRNPTAPTYLGYGYDGVSHDPANPKWDGFNSKDPGFQGFRGEAVGFTVDGWGFYAMPEGSAAKLSFFEAIKPQSSASSRMWRQLR